MSFSIPNKGTPLNDLQSIFFQQYIDILVAAFDKDFVISGCGVTAQGTPNMTVAVAAGQVVSNGVSRSVSAGNATIGTADSSNPRFDLVVINSAGAIAVRAGTAAASPIPPNKSTNDVVLAIVYVPASLSAVASGNIVDLRLIKTNPGLNQPIYDGSGNKLVEFVVSGSDIHIVFKPGGSGFLKVVDRSIFFRSDIGGFDIAQFSGNYWTSSTAGVDLIVRGYGSTISFQDYAAAGYVDFSIYILRTDFKGAVANTAQTPSTIGGNQNNYALPAVKSVFLRLEATGAARHITGIIAGADGQYHEIWNVGTTYDLILDNESSSSSAANRIKTNSGADLTIPPNGCARIRYDNTTQRWRAYLC